VKQVGQSDRAERQLFEYAFHDGVPMAILTDGREWNFFLPGEQGDYGERRV
jgi:predicted type IV restriction endonuclease